MRSCLLCDSKSSNLQHHKIKMALSEQTATTVISNYFIFGFWNVKNVNTKKKQKKKQKLRFLHSSFLPQRICVSFHHPTSFDYLWVLNIWSKKHDFGNKHFRLLEFMAFIFSLFLKFHRLQIWICLPFEWSFR